jgi:hypothetical protein
VVFKLQYFQRVQCALRSLMISYLQRDLTRLPSKCPKKSCTIKNPLLYTSITHVTQIKLSAQPSALGNEAEETKYYRRRRQEIFFSTPPRVPIDTSLQNTPMPPTQSLRPLLRAGARQFQPAHTTATATRCFSSTIRSRAGEQPQATTNHERTTHFGFETVAEADKEARGLFS